MKFQDRLQRDMTAEIEQDETATTIAQQLLELGLIHEVYFLKFSRLNTVFFSISFFQNDYSRVEQSIDKAINVTIASPDVINATSLDAKKTTVVAALITAQVPQNQINTTPPLPPTMIDATETSA